MFNLGEEKKKKKKKKKKIYSNFFKWIRIESHDNIHFTTIK